MTAKEIFELRNQGHKKEAYEAARNLYATDKSPYTSLAMFWTAIDMLRLYSGEGHLDEAEKIFLALERMLPTVPDRDGWVKDAFEKCRELLAKNQKRLQMKENGPTHLQTGIWGEDLAAAYLRDKGYIILERDWHSKHRDIDIIAQDGETTVFVEVKTRSSRDFGEPTDAINHRKLDNLRHAINHYIKYRDIDNYRFDVITIIGSANSMNPEIEHLENFNIQEMICRGSWQRR
jgi:uncharacterized protein (TIGR00252 family)